MKMSIFKNLREIEYCRKPRDFWTNFYHKISVRFVSLIQNTKITPNQLTFASFFFIIGAAGFIASDEYKFRIFGVILIQIGYIFDCADGQLARYKKIFSPFGPWLDSFTDRIKEFALVLALTVNFSRTDDNAFFFGFYTLFLIFLYHGQEITKLPFTSDKEKLKAKDLEKGLIKKLNLLRKKLQIEPFYVGEQYFIISLFVILDRIDLLFYVLVAYGSLTLIIVYPLYKYYHFRISRLR